MEGQWDRVKNKNVQRQSMVEFRIMWHREGFTWMPQNMYKHEEEEKVPLKMVTKTLPQRGWILPLWRTLQWLGWCLREPQNWTGPAPVKTLFTFQIIQCFGNENMWNQVLDLRYASWGEPAEAEGCTVCPEEGLWGREGHWGKEKDGGGSVLHRPFSLFPLSFLLSKPPFSLLYRPLLVDPLV